MIKKINHGYLIALVLIAALVAGYTPVAHFISEVTAANSQNTDSILASIQNNRRLAATAISPNGDLLARVDDSGTTIELVDLASAQNYSTLYEQRINAITELEFSSDGNTLAAIGYNSITLWDIRNSETATILAATDIAPFDQISVGPDRNVTVGIGQNQAITIWHQNGGVLQRRASGLRNELFDAAFSPDGQLIATVNAGPGIQGNLTVVETSSGANRWVSPTSQHQSGFAQPRFSSDGTILAAMSHEGYRINLFDANTGGVIDELVASDNQFTSFAFSADGKVLAAADSMGQVVFWKATGGQLLTDMIVGDGIAIDDLVFNANGELLAIIDVDHQIKLWNLVDGTLQQTLSGHSETIEAFVFSASEATRATSAGRDGQIIVWDILAGGQLFSYQAPVIDSNAIEHGIPAPGVSSLLAQNSEHNTTPSREGLTQSNSAQSQPADEVSTGKTRTSSAKEKNHAWMGTIALSISPDGKRYATTSHTGEIVVWNRANGHEIFSLDAHHGLPVSGVTFSSDGSRLFTAGWDTEIGIWSASSGKLIGMNQAHEHPVRAVATSPDGRYLVSAGEETRIMVWNARTGKLHTILSGHGNSVNSVRFSRDGSMMASGDADGRILLWDIESGKQTNTLLGHAGSINALAYSRDGKTLVSASVSGEVFVWNASTGEQIHIVKRLGSAIRAIAMHPNGRSFATAGVAGDITVWSTLSGQVMNRIEGDSSPINALEFDARGILVSGNELNQLSEWDTDRARRIRTIQAAFQTASR